MSILTPGMGAALRLRRYAGTRAAFLVAVVALGAHAQAADTFSENSVKAAYLYRFAGFVNWPQDGAGDAPFVIAVLGAPDLARELGRLVAGHEINKHAVQARQVTDAHDLGSPQILYVAAGHAQFLRSLAPAADGPPVLLVTDEEGGLNAGSTLNFVTIDHRVRFEVSLTAADRWGLKISSELLSVAVRVQGGRRQSRGEYPLPVGGRDLAAFTGGR